MSNGERDLQRRHSGPRDLVLGDANKSERLPAAVSRPEVAMGDAAEATAWTTVMIDECWR